MCLLERLNKMYLVKRNKIYHVLFYDESGKLISKSTKCTIKSEANKFAVQYLNDIRGKRNKIKLITYTEFKIFYKEYALNRFAKSYQEFVHYAFEQFERVVTGEILLKDIQPYHIEKFIQLKLTEAKERIVNGYLRTLQGAFQRAIEFDYLNENAFKKVKKLKPKQNQPLFPTKDDLTKILEQESDPLLKIIYTFGFYTGMRMGEIRFLKWNSIDFNKNQITISNHETFTTKSKSSRIIPLHKIVREELLRCKKISDVADYIFTKNGKQLSKDYISARFKKAVKNSKVNNDLHFHSLRHGFASNLVLKGVPLYNVSKLLGHADIKTTQIYAHLRSDDLRNAVEMLD